LAVALSFLPGMAQAQSNVVIFAAASLKNALDEIAATWSTDTGKPAPRISYAASSALAKQIEQGAPADLFISADLDWMDYVQGKNLIKTDSRFNLLGNKIVLIAPRDSRTSTLDLKGDDLAKALAGGRLSMANIEAVPAGKYGKAALEKLGAWNAVKDGIAQAENVRAALLLVARGEAPLGIVYSTDAAAEPNVKIVATFPADSHPPIVYPAALTRESSNADAKFFLDFLRSAKARSSFEKQGFTVLVRSGSST
jgi:molybdate transport system substrate-binding protein